MPVTYIDPCDCCGIEEPPPAPFCDLSCATQGILTLGGFPDYYCVTAGASATRETWGYWASLNGSWSTSHVNARNNNFSAFFHIGTLQSSQDPGVLVRRTKLTDNRNGFVYEDIKWYIWDMGAGLVCYTNQIPYYYTRADNGNGCYLTLQRQETNFDSPPSWFPSTMVMCPIRTPNVTPTDGYVTACGESTGAGQSTNPQLIVGGDCNPSILSMHIRSLA